MVDADRHRGEERGWNDAASEASLGLGHFVAVWVTTRPTTWKGRRCARETRDGARRGMSGMGMEGLDGRCKEARYGRERACGFGRGGTVQLWLGLSPSLSLWCLARESW